MLSPNFQSIRTWPYALLLPEMKATQEITPEKFALFLDWLSPDTERAGDEYERLRFRLSTYFSRRNCLVPDELADETINRVIVKLSSEVIENRLAYCYGVAKNVFRESLRKERDHLNIDDVQVAAVPPVEQTFSRDCLDQCLAELTPENRNLILDYFSEIKQAKVELHRKLSEGMEMSQTALRMRVMRIKQKLKMCVEECVS